jgi:hypothetical protein
MAAGIELVTSGSIARKSDHQTTEAVTRTTWWVLAKPQATEMLVCALLSMKENVVPLIPTAVGHSEAILNYP